MMAELFLHFGYAMVFLAAAIEGDATLLTATYLAHRGYLRLVPVVIAATLGSITVNQIYFWAARRYGRQRVADLQRRPVYARVLGWIARYGVPLVLGSRFIYGCRIAIPVACGATGMSPVRFAVGDVAGAIIWGTIVGVAGYALGQALELLVHDLRRYEWWIAAVLILIGVVLTAIRWRTWRSLDTIITPRDTT